MDLFEKGLFDLNGDGKVGMGEEAVGFAVLMSILDGNDKKKTDEDEFQVNDDDEDF